MDTPFATLLGYDAALLKKLARDEVKTLDRLVEAWLLSCLLLACPVAYALWLIEHSLLLASLGAAGAFALILLLLRLSVAGGGAAPHLTSSEFQTWTPALGPSGILLLLAVLLSQPAQLPLWRTELAPVVAAHRTALAVERENVRSELAAHTRSEPSARPEQSEFLVLRLKTVWSKDAPRALRLTFLYALLVLLPALWARLFGLNALRAYERERRAQMLRIIRHDARITEKRATAELAKWAP